jgi:amphi-Trp domain-containing protein
MGEDKGFKPTEDIRDEGRDEDSREFHKLKVRHEAENLQFQMALDYLQQVLETARDGNFLVESDGKSVNLVPANAVDLKIKAKEKDGRQSLAFELAWDNESRLGAQAAEPAEESVYGGACVANRVRTMEEEAGDYDEMERQFELELFGGCGCVAVPGS